ncbi:MAG: DNA polymerase IV [Paludibacteraceae bacterium]
MPEYRKIIHVDMDAFYTSVEQRDNADYCGKPLVVGSPHPRGVIAAASYEARKFGIHSAMSSKKAIQLCPHLIFAPPRFEVYKSVSMEIKAIFSEYTYLIEPLSLDEAFMDVTENKFDIPLAQDIAREIKQKIKQQLNLTASAGVSYNKFLAKIASEMQKPDGLTVIHPQKALEVISRLPIESFWGVGKVTAQRMHQLHIYTGKDLQEKSSAFLEKHFGKAGMMFAEFAKGEDHRMVEPYRERHSVGCERTYGEDIFDKETIHDKFEILAGELTNRLNLSGFHGFTFTLKLKRDDFKVITRSLTADHTLYEKQEFISLAKELFGLINLDGHGIRLTGFSVSNPESNELVGTFIDPQLLIPFDPF